MMHQFMNSQKQMNSLSNPTNNNAFGFPNSAEFQGSDNSQMMKMMLLKNQGLNSQSNLNSQNQNQPSAQNFSGNLMMNQGEKRKNSFNHSQTNFQGPMFNQSGNQSNTPMQSQNHNNFFNFNNNFPQNILKNMMNNKGMIPNSSETKMKPEMMNFPNIKKPNPQQISNLPQTPSQNFPNRGENFPQMENITPINNTETDITKIKEKTKIDRNQKIEKYKNKKRNWKKKISYDCRKKVADARLRIKGRFISKKVGRISLIFLIPCHIIKLYFQRTLKKSINSSGEDKKKHLTTKIT